MNESKLRETFSGSSVLITGGMGFIGSNLAIRLVDLKAHVLILDGLLEGHGGNPFNIESICDKARVNVSDIRDFNALRYLVEGKDFIFHLAGQNDHVLSLTNPFPDIDINIKGTATLLEACKRYNPKAKLVYTGTRGEYGPSTALPVREDAPLHPKGIYELSSLTAQKLFQVFHDNHNLRSVTLRLTNTYGPRAQMRHDRFGVANWFVRKAIDNETIQLFGDGSIMRDFLYVEDAVEAILACASTPEAFGEIFNVGIDVPSSFLEFAKKVISVTGTGSWEFVPFTPDRAAQEPGHYYSDITKIRTIVKWEPKIDLDEGVRRTVEYYNKYKDHYWNSRDSIVPGPEA